MVSPTSSPSVNPSRSATCTVMLFRCANVAASRPVAAQSCRASFSAAVNSAAVGADSVAAVVCVGAAAATSNAGGGA